MACANLGGIAPTRRPDAKARSAGEALASEGYTVPMLWIPRPWGA
jgi:hypothetical protein